MKKRKKMKNKFLVVKKIIGNFLEPSRYKMHETKQTNNRKKNKMRNTNCIFLDMENDKSCDNKTKYIVDVHHKKDPETGLRIMSCIDVECCEKHHQQTKDCDNLSIHNVKRKQ